MWYLHGSEQEQENTTSLVPVIKQLCFYKNRKLCMHSENTARHVYQNSLRIWAKMLQVTLIRAWWHVQGKVHLLCVQNQGCGKVTWCNYVTWCKEWATAETPWMHYPFDFELMWGVLETVYCGQISPSSHIHLYSSTQGQIHSWRTWGPASTLLKWPCEADWRVITPHTKCQDECNQGFCRDYTGEQKGKSVWGLEVGSGGQYTRAQFYPLGRSVCTVQPWKLKLSQKGYLPEAAAEGVRSGTRHGGWRARATSISQFHRVRY